MKKVNFNFRKRILLLMIPFILLFTNLSSHAEWTIVTPPYVSQNSWELWDVHFSSPYEGWAVGSGGDYLKGVLLRYSNGIWTNIKPPEVSSKWYLWGVHFTSINEGWAVGIDFSDTYNTKGVLLHHSNGSWTSVNPPAMSNWGLESVYFLSPNEGYAVGWDSIDSKNEVGVILYYSNGLWQSINPPPVSSMWELKNVYFISSNEGWAVGTNKSNQNGVILHYSNGSWVAVNPPYVSSNWYLNDVHFSTINEGWAAGGDISNQQGVLLHYSNGTWTPITPFPSPPSSHGWTLNSVHLSSPIEGWAVGNSNKGALFHYLNSSWTLTDAPPIGGPTVYLNSVHFTSSNNGWAVGNNIENGTMRGVLLKYSSSAPCPIPGTPSNPSPQNGATGISTSPTLSWSSCSNTDSYDVYFGTSSNPPYVGNTTSTSYSQSGLSYNTLYYWKIVAKNNCGNSTSGSVWSFTTGTISTINITVTSPNGGENWKAGTTQKISWTYTGNPGKYVKIELLKGEAVNRTIAYRTNIGSGGSGSYSWRMLRFQTAGSDYKVRITSFNNSSYTDTSDNNFTISK